MNVVLTGCNGRLGRACADHLVERGVAVTGVDAQGSSDRPHPVLVADLRDPFAIHRALDMARDVGGGTIDALVHLANHPRPDVGPPEMVLRENLAMNTSAFMGAADRGVKRIVFSSSVQAVLGGVERELGGEAATLPARLPIDEDTEPRPTNAYGLSKLLTERMLDELCRMRDGLTAVSLRFPFVMPAWGFEHNARRTAPSEQIWGATEAFMYVHVDDAADALRRAASADGIEGHECVWLSAPDPRPPDDPADLVARALSGVPGAEEAAANGGFVDVSKARRLLGWTPARLLREARRATAT